MDTWCACPRHIPPTSALTAGSMSCAASRMGSRPLPRRPQRHAQVQQPGSLHAHGDAAVDKILAGDLDKSSLWEINTEQEYHEEKEEEKPD